MLPAAMLIEGTSRRKLVSLVIEDLSEARAVVGFKYWQLPCCTTYVGMLEGDCRQGGFREFRGFIGFKSGVGDKRSKDLQGVCGQLVIFCM
jgi:hypothetical protein